MIRVRTREEHEELPRSSVVITKGFQLYLRTADGLAPRDTDLSSASAWDLKNQLTVEEFFDMHGPTYAVYYGGMKDSMIGWLDTPTVEQANEHCTHEEDGSCFNMDHFDASEADEHCGHAEDGTCFDSEHIDAGDAHEYCGHEENADCFDSEHIHPDDAHDYCGHDEDECSHGVHVLPGLPGETSKGNPVGVIHLDGYRLCEEWEMPSRVRSRLEEILS